MRIQFKSGQLEVFALVLMTAGVGLFFVIHTTDERRVGHDVTHAVKNNRKSKSFTRRVYHENLAGVGRLDDYVIPSHLKSRFAEFEAKYVEVVTPDLGWTEWEIGPIVLKDIDSIRPLPPAPIAIEIDVTRYGVDPLGVEVLFSFKNISNEQVDIRTSDINIGFPEYHREFHLSESSPVEGAGYTARQMSFDLTYGKQFEGYFSGLRFTDELPFSNMPSYGTGFRLRPQESVPCLWRTALPKPGRYEVAVRYYHHVPDGTGIPVRAWKVIDVPVLHERPNPQPLTIRATVRTELAAFGLASPWRRRYTILGRLFNETGRSRHIFASAWLIRNDDEPWRTRAKAAGGLGLPVELVLYGRDGQLVEAPVNPDEPDGPPVRRLIGPDGIPFRFHVEQIGDRPLHIDRIEFWMITDAGLEKLTIAKDLPVVEFPDPAWGSTVHGRRCRIRQVKDRLTTQDEVRFGLELESDHAALEPLQAHFEFLFDGRLATQFDSEDWKFGWRSSFSLRDVKATAGRHKLQAIIQGKPGSKFEESLISNELEIEIIDLNSTK